MHMFVASKAHKARGESAQSQFKLPSGLEDNRSAESEGLGAVETRQATKLRNESRSWQTS